MGLIINYIRKSVTNMSILIFYSIDREIHLIFVESELCLGKKIFKTNEINTQ